MCLDKIQLYARVEPILLDKTRSRWRSPPQFPARPQASEGDTRTKHSPTRHRKKSKHASSIYLITHKVAGVSTPQRTHTAVIIWYDLCPTIPIHYIHSKERAFTVARKIITLQPFLSGGCYRLLRLQGLRSQPGSRSSSPRPRRICCRPP